jgi:outer membrane protein OmpA-like peptidoglycan-associated protein
LSDSTHGPIDGPSSHRRIDRSRGRADAVKDLLVKAGVPGNRLATVGLGSEKPVPPNDTPEGRAKNRRIELSLSKSP